jgi:fumarate reductase flavoprotein subunit
MSVAFVADLDADLRTGVLIVGAGACGVTAALSAAGCGVDVLVLEQDARPAGSTALSSGLIPAAGTRMQRALGIEDTPALFAADIMAKNGHTADPAIVAALARQAAGAVEFLADRHEVPFSVVEGFRYPGHSVLRMHGTPARTGAELMGYLLTACERQGIDIVCDSRVTRLFADYAGRVLGVEAVRPDGVATRIGCGALVLASNGYGGDPALVRQHIPQLAEALYFGHAGNRGEALLWGTVLGGASADLSGHQGHGSVATPHGILITWAVMMEGGIQVNRDGQRFSNEHLGYSEQAEPVLAQPDGIAIDIFDERLHTIAAQFEDYRAAVELGAVKRAGDVAQLARLFALPPEALAATLAESDALAERNATDRFGRRFEPAQRLHPPYYGVRVTGALFHTQGGLVIDPHARVLRQEGTPIPRLYAGGGAARGVSGAQASGYLSGNGLLSAVTLGRIAGCAAAAEALGGN